ncbi:unnamed protein product [Albugo candida]|uniref:Chromo domain-containing protein n=1 Tax=Albugo candida TaxID=65357 RepID=A0A024G4Q4_9STRA|nr:unnamed protein product [Albugo candida]|eukprot:CCI41522.1 unnamed protein product [Albugo candida]
MAVILEDTKANQDRAFVGQAATNCTMDEVKGGYIGTYRDTRSCCGSTSAVISHCSCEGTCHRGIEPTQMWYGKAWMTTCTSLSANVKTFWWFRLRGIHVPSTLQWFGLNVTVWCHCEYPIKALISKKWSKFHTSCSILSLCQSSINHLRSIRLDGIAPLTAVTALPPQDPNSIIYQPDGLTGMSSFTEHEINKNNRYTCKISRKHLPLCTNTSPIRRGTRKKRQGADTKRKMACRPLVSNSASLSYLEMPFDAKASIRRENIPCYPRLRDYATWAFGPAFSGLQRNPDTHQSEVLVQWRVLDEAEISWEPARILFEDVALLLAQWVRSDERDLLEGNHRGYQHLTRKRYAQCSPKVGLPLAVMCDYFHAFNHSIRSSE